MEHIALLSKRQTPQIMMSGFELKMTLSLSYDEAEVFEKRS